MTDQLPQRGFTTLAPPPEGAVSAVREGRGMRRRRRLAGAGAAAVSVALVAGVAVAAGGGSSRAVDELVPAVHPTHAPEPQPTPLIDGRRPGSASRGAAAPGTGVSGGASTTTGGASADRATGSTSQTRAESAGGSRAYRTPALRRTYKAGPGPSVPTTQQGPNPRLCGATVYDDPGNGFGTSSDWCVASIVTTTSRGHDLTVEICRDSTSSGRLTFARTREVELVVRAGSKTVWQWSTGQPDAAHRHTLDAGADGCWLWTAPWTDVNARGEKLQRGSYTLVVTGAADEIVAINPVETAFQVR